MVVWLRDWPGDRRVAGSIPETTDFLTNSSIWTGYLTLRCMHPRDVHCANWCQLASGLGH